MGIPDERLYEYAVVRYVPRVDREEFVNIGLIMMSKRSKWLRGEIQLDGARLRAFDPGVNLEALQKQASVFMRGDVPSPDVPVEERYRWLSAVKSAVLQVSPSHPGILVRDGDPSCAERECSDSGQSVAARLDAEFERLFDDLVCC